MRRSKYALRVTQQQQCEAVRAHSCQQAAPKQYVSVLISSGLMPLRCASLFCVLSHTENSWKRLKSTQRIFSVLCVHARRVEMVIFRKQWGREESSRWSDRDQLPNEVSLVAPGVKRPCVLLLLSLKKGAALRSISRSIFTLDFYSNISTMA